MPFPKALSMHEYLVQFDSWEINLRTFSNSILLIGLGFRFRVHVVCGLGFRVYIGCEPSRIQFFSASHVVSVSEALSQEEYSKFL